MLSTSSMGEMGPASGSSSPFVWKYCRMCALEVKQGVYIFGEEGKRLQIPEKIRKTVAILVLEEDSLPKKICTSCCNSLEAYTQFKDSVVDAQEKLSAIAKSIEKSQEQSLLQMRNKQVLKSPRRSKMYQSVITPHSSCHVMLPTPSVISAPEPDMAEPAIECDEPPSSVASLSSDEEDNTTPKSAPECLSSNDYKNDNDNIQVALQGSSPPLSITKHSIRETKNATTPPSSETDDSPTKNVNKSPVYGGESSSNSFNNNDSSAVEFNQYETNLNLLCGICSSHFKDKESLISHHIKNHSSEPQNEPIFGCTVCPRLTPSYETLRQHMHKHRVAGLFKCPDCDKGFSTKDQLHVHITSKHNQVSGKSAKLCNLSTNTSYPPSMYERKKHANNSSSSNSSANPIQSGESSTAFSPFSQTAENLSCTADEFSGASNPNRDAGSGESNSVQPTNNVSPVKSDRGDVSPTAAKVDLSRSTSTVNSQEQANKNAIFKLTVDDEKDGFWKCDYCDKILRSKNGYDTHMATHKGRRFACNHCGVTYTQKSSLEHHVKVHHTNIGKEFECPECSKRFKTFRQLGWHKKTHEKPLTDVRCPQCEKLFKNMVSFKTHLKLHRGSKKFACVECPKAFYTKAKLQEHMNSHSGKRPFGCPVDNCSKVFSCFSNYAKHFKKQHFSMIGPKGSMIPPPKMVESNNNVVPIKQTEVAQKRMQINNSVKSAQNSSPFAPVKDTSTASTSNGVTKTETNQVPPAVQSQTSSTGDTHTHNSTSLHPSFQIGTPNENPSTQTQTVLRPLPGIYSGLSSNNLGVQTSSTSSQTFTTQNSCGSIMLLPSNSHSHNSPLPLHVTTNASTNENISLAHAQSQSVPMSSLQSHSHHHLSHPVNVHAHSSAHTAHTNHAPSSASTQTHHPNQFQPPNHSQTVWQPVVLPSSKSFHNSSASANLSTINSLDLLDCAGTVHSSESLTSNSNNNHSHSQHQQTSVNIIPTSINAAHHATSHASSIVHAHHDSSVSGSGHSSNPHIPSSHHSSTSSNTAPHSTTSSSGHNIPVSSSSGAVNIPTFGSLTQQNEPMELRYKDSNNFQDMPMELTKVFQRDPLELCVRQDFGNQPLMDLSSRVVNVTVGGNSSMNVSSMSMNISGNSSSNNNNNNSNNNTSSQNHYPNISNGNGSTSTSILTVPYHKQAELVERELTLNDFTGAFRQPIDLISRSEDQSHELCSEGNLVDLSLRSSFGQDQSASSFLRELIDLSSRSDSFHGEVNLTNKPHQSSSNSHSQIHHSHSSGHHPLSKSTAASSNSVSGHHHHHNHHTHHHHNIQSHQSSSSGASTASLQPVMYSDTSSMFN